MTGIAIRHDRLEFVPDPGDPVRVTRNRWTCVGNVVESSPGHTVIAFEVPPPDGLSDEEELSWHPTPFCRSAIDARASVCPKCAKDQPK